MKQTLIILLLIVGSSLACSAGEPHRTFIHLPDGMLEDTDIGQTEWFGVRKLVPWTDPRGISFVSWPSDIYKDPILALSQPDTLWLIGDFPWEMDCDCYPETESFRKVPGGHYSGTLEIPEIRYRTSEGNIIDRGWVKVISSAACANCTELTKVIFPKLLKQVRRGAFYGCTGLEEVVPNGARDVRLFHFAFQGCTSLRKIDLTFAAYPREDDFQYEFEGQFADCPNLEEVTVTATTGNARNLRGRNYASLKRINVQVPEGAELKNESRDIFLDEEYRSALLVVPDGMSESMAATEPWCFFSNIKTTSEAAGIEDVESLPCARLVNIDGGVITLIDYDTVVEVYAVSGVKVAELSAAMPSLDGARGYFLLRSNSAIQKIYME